MNIEFPSERWRDDPGKLPALSADAEMGRAGDRRAGARHCARCAASLDEAPVVKGMWVYCSIECALKIENER